METLQFSKIEGFDIKGTIHLTVNNQLGFTAPAQAGRTSHYSTDIAKTISAPIFHVNADYPEEVVRVMVIAEKYRQKFEKDVFVDLVGYRRHGHNELDEPSFTQPVMYQAIRDTKTVASKYADALIVLLTILGRVI